MHEVLLSTCSSLSVWVDWKCSKQRMATHIAWGEEADQIHRLSPKVKAAVYGEQGILTSQVAFLQCQWLCGTVVILKSVDNLPFDVKVYARERNLMFLSHTVWI